MANAKLADRVDAIYKNSTQLANARDYLNMLAASEGTASRGDRGYNVMFRGDLVNDYSRHPNMVHTYIDKNGKQGKSTAAGRYQFLYKTYEEMAKKLGITDFSPESQDKVAIALMLEKGVDFDDGADFGANLRKINNVWTSLAGSSLGAQYHSTRSFQQNLDAFNQSRASRGMNPVTSAWNNTAYQTSPASLTSGMAQADVQRAMAQANSYLESLGLPKGGFLGQAMADINKKVYAEPGAIPFQMYSGNRFTVSSNPYLTPENLASMNARLHSTDPNVQYGVSMFGDGFHPTVAVTAPNGAVGVGTDVPTTLSVAPALSDGGVPVEDATRARQTVAPATAQPAPVVAPTATPVQQSTPQPLPTAVPQTLVSGASNGGASTPQASPAGASQPVVYPNSDAYHTGETTSGGMVRYNPATGDVEVAQPVVTQYRTGTPANATAIPKASDVSSVFNGMNALQSTGVKPSDVPVSGPEYGIVPTNTADTGTGDLTTGAWVIPNGGIPQFQSGSTALQNILDQPQTGRGMRNYFDTTSPMLISEHENGVIPANVSDTGNGNVTTGAWVVPNGGVPQSQSGSATLQDLLDQPSTGRGLRNYVYTPPVSKPTLSDYQVEQLTNKGNGVVPAKSGADSAELVVPQATRKAVPLTDTQLDNLVNSTSNGVIPVFGGQAEDNSTVIVPQATPQPQSQPQMFIPDLSPTVVPANTQSTSNGTSVGAWVIPVGKSQGSIVPQFQNTGVDALRDLLDQTVIRQRDLPS